MIIGFKPQFVDPILNGTKIHTIRLDPYERWKPGMKMHMATGVRTKHYKQFAEKICVGVSFIHIFPESQTVSIGTLTDEGVIIKGMIQAGVEKLAKT